MKVVLFCAGMGTRIREYSEEIPKPMIPIAGQPILGHIMKYYRQHGHNQFVLCLGHQAEVIRDHFLKSQKQTTTCNDRGDLLCTDRRDEVRLVDTGLLSNIGQRLWSVRDLVADDEMFLANYSDGLTDVDLDEMIKRFRSSGKVACFLAVRPPLTYHVADIAEDGRVRSLLPSVQSEIWINGGYFVFRPEIFDYIRDGEELVVEPFQRLIEDDQLLAYKHEGFWQAMDTIRDRQILEDLVAKGCMPWWVQPKRKAKRESLAMVV